MISRIASNGGWCWFQDPRILKSGRDTFIGFVASGKSGPDSSGEIRVAVYDSKKLRARPKELLLDAPSTEAEVSKYSNDHNSPSLVKLPSGRLLAFWTLHGKEGWFYTRAIDSKSRELIGETQAVVVGDESKITYSNPIFLASEGRLYNFFRGLDATWKPSWVYSDDEGNTWSEARILIDVPGDIRRRPYVKYATDNEGSIHFFFTDDHPGSFHNNIYHMVYRSGVGLLDSIGNFIADIETGISSPQQATRLWSSSPSQTAWVIDSKVDEEGVLRLLFQVRDMKSESTGEEHPGEISYFLATQRNGEWSIRYLASAGPALYSKQQDYVGLGTLSPTDSDQLVISARLDPRTGKQLKNWTLFEARLNERDLGISWSRVMKRATDCIRPILMPNGDGTLTVYWLEGKYNSYTSYELSVMAKSLKAHRKSG